MSAAAPATAQAARKAAAAMDAVIVVVAVLTMGFSLGNIHDFALAHGTDDPIAWFLAPAVDLALIGALMGDAFLSRHGLDAGPWAKALRWFAGLATLALNVWESVTARDMAGIVLHATPPILLFCLAEAAVPYRQRFAAVVRAAAEQAPVDTEQRPVDTRPAVAVDPAPVAVDTAPPRTVDQVSTPVSTPVDVDTLALFATPAARTAPDPFPQVEAPAAPAVDLPEYNPPAAPEVDTDVDTEQAGVDTREQVEEVEQPEVDTAPEATEADVDTEQPEVDTPEPARLSTEQARAVIEAGWKAGRSARSVAKEATRHHSYVTRIYKELDEEAAAATAPAPLTLVKEGTTA